MLTLRGERAAALVLVDALSDAGDRRLELRHRMRRLLEQLLQASAPGLDPARAETMAVVLQNLLKTVPRLADEEDAGHPGVISEIRALIQLYIDSARATA